MAAKKPKRKAEKDAPAHGFARLDTAGFPEFTPGSVWLVGAGPGAPALMTLLGYYALQRADAVVYDALVNDAILNWAQPEAKIEYAGKRGGRPSAKQRDISLRLIELARDGRRVVRLKGGDPLIFGRGGEECQMLSQAGVPFRIVPGITAGIGGLGYAGVPLTHREVNQSVLFLTGHDQAGAMPSRVDWRAVATAAPVIVMYMAVRNIAAIAERLIGFGRARSDPVAIVSNATLPHQSVLETTLGAIGEGSEVADLPTPALVVVGRVVSLRNTLDWYAAALRENKLG
jgi:uroporphyrin-III C-methyltransferase